MTKSGGEPVEVQCTREEPFPCNYIWTTKSPLRSISCPNCGYTIRNKQEAIDKAKRTREAEANAGKQ